MKTPSPLVANSEISNQRFGNQIYQYFFLKIVEQKLAVNISAGDWIGTEFFRGVDTVKHENSLPTPVDLEKEIDRNNGPEKQLLIIEKAIFSGANCINIKGSFQYHTGAVAEYKALFFNTFQIRDEQKERLDILLRETGLINKYIIGMHVRRGDYRQLQRRGSPFFWIPSLSCYVDALNSMMFSAPKNAVVYLASDEAPEVRAELADAGVPSITSAELASNLDETLCLMLDFYVLTIANALIISNSSFSMSAAMLNTVSKVNLRPGGLTENMVPFDPWNSHVLLPRAF
jgi:hypothetical protein